MADRVPLPTQSWHRRLLFGGRLHRDESGVISLLTVFVMLGCTWLLLWLLNSAKQLDSKVRMQNAVDAAGQSGVGILARGMNAVAFANQLEAELLAAVAVMQAAEGTSAATSPLVALLPVFQEILAGLPGQLPPDRPIPAFRSDVVRRIPSLADEVTRRVGRANGLWRGANVGNTPDGPQGPLVVQLWTTSGLPIGRSPEYDPQTRTLPLIDPTPLGPDAPYLNASSHLLELARRERERMVRRYVGQWALDLASGDPAVTRTLLAKAEFNLRLLLDGIYRDSNLPLILRDQSPGLTQMERDFMFMAVAYRAHSKTTAPLMFHNPNAALAPAMAFAQLHLFLPRPRYTCCPWGETRINPRTDEEYFISNTDGWPTEWEASTQNWHAKLVPATARSISSILSSEAPGGNGNPPRWGRLSPRQIDALTHH